ncbi:MAG: hypothetical protein ABIK53_07545 [bacterium]
MWTDIFQSFIGGGAVAGIIVAIIHWKSKCVERRVANLRDQLQHLYGPLYFFVSQNKRLFKINDKFHQAYRKVYGDPKWSNDEETRKVLNEESTRTLNLANAYIEQVENNNDKIIEILERNYSLVDIDDIGAFSEFIVDYTRRKTEWDEQHFLKTPRHIYSEVGKVSFMRPKVIKRVKDKFISKREELDKLNEVWHFWPKWLQHRNKG